MILPWRAKDKDEYFMNIYLCARWRGLELVSALPAGGQNRWRERGVLTKSWNVRPAWNSCCTLCPDCLTACDSRENKRINNPLTVPTAHSDALEQKEGEKGCHPPSITSCDHIWNFPYLSPALHHKMWKFPPAWFEAGSSAADRKPEEGQGARGECSAEETEQRRLGEGGSVK